MRFVDKCSYVCANYIVVKKNESHEKRRIYYFGFQIIMGTFLEALTIAMISMLLGTFISTMAVLVAFSMLRVIAGGYHMDTYGKCFFVSLAIFIIAGLIADNTYKLVSLMHIAILVSVTFFIGVFSMIRWAPADTANKRISDEKDKKRFKILSLSYLAFWLFIELILIYINQPLFIIAGCLGILIEALIITPLAYKVFDKLSGA